MRIYNISSFGALLPACLCAALSCCQGCSHHAAGAKPGGGVLGHAADPRQLATSTRITFTEVWIDTPNGWALNVAGSGAGKITCGGTHQCGFDVLTFDFAALVRRLELAADATHANAETPVCSVNFVPVGGRSAIMRPVDDWTLILGLFQRAHRNLLSNNRADIDPLWARYPPSTQPSQ